MFEPYRIAAGTEPVYEAGIFNPAVGRWVGVRDGAIALIPGAGISLGEFFPSEKTAGSDQFAHELLDALKANKPPYGLTLSITEQGLADCIVCSLRTTRTRYTETSLKIKKLEGRGTLFDMAGNPANIKRFEQDYLRRNPSAIITCLEARSAPDPEQIIRVWHRN